jgi:hypothetical protein
MLNNSFSVHPLHPQKTKIKRISHPLHLNTKSTDIIKSIKKIQMSYLLVKGIDMWGGDQG